MVEPPRPKRTRRTAQLHVRCTEAELAAIEARAASTGLPLSEFVRVAALHVTVRARADLDAVQGLAKTAGDLGRLGGLLKLWLAERRGDGVSAVEVDKVLSEIRAVIDRLADKAMSL